jgi:hypothetical protein
MHHALDVGDASERGAHKQEDTARTCYAAKHRPGGRADRRTHVDQGAASMAKTRDTHATTTPKRTSRIGRLTVDQAVIAVLLSAMDANLHVSPEEAWRAHHLIWSMRRFRNQPGEKVDRLIEIVRDRMEEFGNLAIIQQAARAIPAHLRTPVFAAAVDLMLVDTRLERGEREFVKHLAAALKIRPQLVEEVLRVLLIKNGA